jgi:predicted N-acetyltransferase YhbS
VSPVSFPDDFRLERLKRDHPRARFRCGQDEVEQWLANNALQHQEKQFSVTKVLVDQGGAIVGCYTLATGQVDFSELPADLAKRLSRRVLPVAILAWLGVSEVYQGQGLGRLLMAQRVAVSAVIECHKRSFLGASSDADGSAGGGP